MMRVTLLAAIGLASMCCLARAANQGGPAVSQPSASTITYPHSVVTFPLQASGISGRHRLLVDMVERNGWFSDADDLPWAKEVEVTSK